ncbi:NAD(P)-binding domain-containing protein [Streptomyces thermocarboxydus]
MTDTLTVTVLGTGIMGAAMARNLLKAGHRPRLEPHPRQGRPARRRRRPRRRHPAEAVESADVVLTMLFDGPATLETMRAAARPSRGAVWAQCTTSGIEDVAELAAFARDHGLRFYDSPVLGTRKPAEDGQLTVLAAGPVESRDTVTPVFDAVGARTVDRRGRSGGRRHPAEARRQQLGPRGHRRRGRDPGAGPRPRRRPARLLRPHRQADPRHGLPARQGAADPRGAAVPGPVRGEDRRQGRRTHRAVSERHGARLDVAAASARRLERAAAQGHADEDMAAAYYASFEDGPASTT